MDLLNPEAGWVERAAYPDLPRDSANSVAVDARIYVFAGQGRLHADDKVNRVNDTVYCYDPAADGWTKLETRSPVGLLATAAVSLDDRTVLFFGGVNKAVFDGFNIDCSADAATDPIRQYALMSRYFGLRPQDYFFTPQVVAYEVGTNTWRNVSVIPGTQAIGCGVAVQGNRVTLIGGEIKPGLRTPTVRTVTVSGGARLDWALEWSSPDMMPPPHGADSQDGIAGAFAGHSRGVLIAAGGANFPGSLAQFAAGRNWAHKGLHKVWHADVYACTGDGQWRVAGALPQGCGYGATVQLDDSVLIVGGELQDGEATSEVLELRWNGTSVDVIR